MKLYRYLLASFRPDLSQPWDNKKGVVGDVSVEIGIKEKDEDGRDRRLVSASIALTERPKLDAQSRILIPAKERELCEGAAEYAIDLISVLESVSRTLLSPLQCVALAPENQDERDFLERSAGLLPVQKTDSAVGFDIEWTPEIGAALNDRLMGVAMLAEAFSGAETGTYRDLVRFIELGFAPPFYDKRLHRKLADFLTPAPYRYTRVEIDEWAALRHPITHADFKKSAWVAMTSDVRPILFRMRQACLDLLFNKAEWGNPSSVRRDIWRPNAFIASADGRVVVKQGTKLKFLFRRWDEFDVYPSDLKVSIDHSKPGFYAKYFQSPNPAPPQSTSVGN